MVRGKDTQRGHIAVPITHPAMLSLVTVRTTVTRLFPDLTATCAQHQLHTVVRGYSRCSIPDKTRNLATGTCATHPNTLHSHSNHIFHTIINNRESA